MNSKKSVMVSFSLYEFGTGDLPHPRDIEEPENVIFSKWVPQTMADSIWILYEFTSIRQRDLFVDSPPAPIDKARIMKRKQAFFDHWVDGVHSSPKEWS
jgi:hypothetical protein